MVVCQEEQVDGFWSLGVGCLLAPVALGVRCDCEQEKEKQEEEEFCCRGGTGKPVLVNLVSSLTQLTRHYLRNQPENYLPHVYPRAD